MRLLLTRDFSGFGDWLFSLAVMRLVQRQRPDVEIHVSFRTTGEPLQPIVPEAFAASDLEFRLGVPSKLHLSTGHFVYTRRSSATYIADMVEVLNARTGLGIVHAPAYPVFRFPQPRERGYVALVSQGKGSATPKDWGTANFSKLAELLADHVELVQIGARGDAPLPGVSRRILGESFTRVAQALAGARAFVGIENGMMVLAGFLRVPQLTIYCNTGRPDRVAFDNHIKIRDRAAPAAVAEGVIACL